ncbi:FG-GAP repeat [Carpediemonas membranifera]|uniref:FG-GAP repeat n=1 Tax=Carpediemonas membranifera TaxID=201153 RepID=A0A8J6B241_9EUKA|nr:FG-GAP repeat [Carpediemonas membranifera]|eukprot:KAG9392629.1 FG-GAP repeat [Carpediemonas membranifera]
MILVIFLSIFVTTTNGAFSGATYDWLPSNVNSYDLYGTSVAHGSTGVGVVGAPGDATYGTAAGRAYAVWSSSTYDVLISSDIEEGDKFGTAVAMPSSSVLAVGAPRKGDTIAGAVYIFSYTSTHVFSQQQKLTPPSNPVFANFGAALAMTTSTLAVGAYGYDSATGAVYIYTGGGASWTYQTMVQASDAAENDYFGQSVAIISSYLVVGAPGESSDKGAAYVFTGSSSSWSQQAKLTGSSTNAGDAFGTSVAIHSARVVVGAPYYSATYSSDGALYSYTRSGTTWSQEQRFTSPTASTSGKLGTAVGVYSNIVYGGAPGENSDNGRVHYWTEIKGAWGHRQYFSYTSTANNNYGAALSVYGSSLLIGGPGSSPEGTQAGLAHRISMACSVSAGSVCLTTSSNYPCNTGYYSASTSATDCTAAPAGGYVSTMSGPVSTYSSCGSGTYQDSTAQTSCDSVSPGYYANSGRTGQSVCSTGYYSEGNCDSCTQAQAGYYVLSSDKTKQRECWNGHYQPNSGQSSCLISGVGYYAPATTPQTSQSACASGYYAPAQSASCTQVSAGNYAKSSDLSKPYMCNDGKYQPDAGQTACLTAAKGHYVPANGAQTVQTSCNGVGDYQDETGQATCKKADAGYRPAENRQSQVSCSDGYYSPGELDSCTRAQAGYYVSTTDRSEQVACNNGKYQPNSGQTECLTASKGHKVPTGGAQIAQIDCDGVGDYQDETGQATCKKADAGYRPAENRQSQVACATGTYSAGGVDSCTLASAGYYVDSSNKSAQLPCDAGKYQPYTGQSACLTASPGYFVPSAASIAQLPCNGTGQYQDESGASSCKTAAAGYFANDDHTAQVACATGYYSEGGANACTASDPGHYVLSSNKTKQWGCTVLGTYSLGAASGCTTVAKGYRALTNFTGIVYCDDVGGYQDETGQTTCKTVAEGYYPSADRTAAVLCATGYYSYGAADACTQAELGYYALANHTDHVLCDGTGEYQDEVGQTGCRTTEAGYYPTADRTDQQHCEDGYYSPTDGCETCTAADPAYYVSTSDRTAQIRCTVAGTYSLGGAGSATGCTEAEPGYYALCNNTDHVLCDGTGQYQDETGQTTCKVTAAGYYSSGDRATQLPCATGFYSYGRADSCTEAELGYYALVNHTAHIPCNSGQFQDETGQLECKNVSTPGQYTPVSGAWAEPLSCPDGFDVTEDFTGCSRFLDYITGYTESVSIDLAEFVNTTTDLVISNIGIATVPPQCSLASTVLTCTEPVDTVLTVSFEAGGTVFSGSAVLQLQGLTEPAGLVRSHVVGRVNGNRDYDLGYWATPLGTACPLTYSLTQAPDWATVNDTALILAPTGPQPASNVTLLTVTNCQNVTMTKVLTLTYMAIDQSNVIAGKARASNSTYHSIIFDTMNDMAVTNVSVSGQTGVTVRNSTSGEAIYVPIGSTVNGTTSMTVTLSDGTTETLEVAIPATTVRYNATGAVTISNDTMMARTPAVNGSCAASLEASYLGEMNVTTVTLEDGTIYCVTTETVSANMLATMTYAVYEDSSTVPIANGSTPVTPEHLCVGILDTVTNSTAGFTDSSRYLIDLNGVTQSTVIESSRVCVDASFVSTDAAIVPVTGDGAVSLSLLFDEASVFSTEFVVEPMVVDEFPWLTVIGVALAIFVTIALCLACIITTCVSCTCAAVCAKSTHIFFKKARIWLASPPAPQGVPASFRYPVARPQSTMADSYYAPSAYSRTSTATTFTGMSTAPAYLRQQPGTFSQSMLSSSSSLSAPTSKTWRVFDGPLRDSSSRL